MTAYGRPYTLSIDAYTYRQIATMDTTTTLAVMPQTPRHASEKRSPVTARVLDRVIDALQAMADADDRTLSYMIEKALREFVERHAPADPARPARKGR